MGGPYVETRGFIGSLSSLSIFSIVTRCPRKSYQQSPLQTIDFKAESSTPNNLRTCDRCAGLGRAGGLAGWQVGRWTGGGIPCWLSIHGKGNLGTSLTKPGGGARGGERRRGVFLTRWTILCTGSRVRRAFVLMKIAIDWTTFKMRRKT